MDLKLLPTTPKHLKLKYAIISDIKQGKYKPGDKLPPEREMMRIYRASYSTVARALNDLKQGGFIERYHGKGTFVSYVEPTVKHLAILFTDAQEIAHPYMGKILKGINKIVEDHGWIMNLFPIKSKRIFHSSSGSAINKLIKTNSIHGVIIASDFLPEDIETLINLGIPVVSIELIYHLSHCLYVIEDSSKIADMLLNFLLRKGYKSAALITGPIMDPSVKLIRASTMFTDAIVNALELANITLNPEFILPTRYDFEEVKDQIVSILKSPARPEILIFRDDIIAAHTLRLARNMGIKIPEDMSIISYGDILEYSDLTVIEMDFKRFGELACKLIVDQDVGKKSISAPEPIPPVSIIERSTTR